MYGKSDAYVSGAWYIADGDLCDIYATPDDEPFMYEQGTQEYIDWKQGALDEYDGKFNVYKLYKESFNKPKVKWWTSKKLDIVLYVTSNGWFKDHRTRSDARFAERLSQNCGSRTKRADNRISVLPGDKSGNLRDGNG